MTGKVEVENVNDVERKILINVDSDTVNQKLQDFFNNISKNVEMRGFRKGKVPPSILHKKYRKEALGSVSQTLISEFYQMAIRDNDINPISSPVIQSANPNSGFVGSFDSDNSYSVEMLVEVLPSIDPVGYDDLELDFPDRNVESIRSSIIKDYQSQFAERAQITDGVAENGDALVIDFKGFIDGVEFAGGSSENFNLESLGGNTLIPGFESQLVGLGPGESKRTSVSFPENYSAQQLAGKEAEFDVVIKSIVRKKLADVDDDLALMAGFDSLEDFLSHAQNEANKRNVVEDRRFVEAKIASDLIKINQFDVPGALVKAEEDRLYKVNKVQSPNDSVKKQIHDAAINNVKKALLIDAIYEKEDSVKVAPNQLNEFLEEQASINNQSKDELVSFLHNTNQMDSFIGVLKTQNVLDFIRDINFNKAYKEESKE